MTSPTPQGLRLTTTPEARTVHLDPWLVEHGRRDVATAVTTVSIAAFSWKVLSFAVALVVLVVGLGWIAIRAVRDLRRAAVGLDVRLGRDDLRLTWRQGGREGSSERVFLRDVGRVDVVEAGYQRWHAVAQVVGRAPLRIPMERESEAAVRWVADTLAAAGRKARERDGDGAAEVPPALRRLDEP